ncbi:MgtC/SapB family protein [Solicola gregarius]|uniref:MgtC/SapB family protein n=1 Tax=Solicola gregarius TaxID=2908642 RepID=A0AA46TM53_9ACTN|nr:MgtC/SapB family protein [Solicola gregarius]UYM07795.1 MgtC/SapB family protein [Solicola gregarius]
MQADVDPGSWIQVADLVVALALSALIGLEREVRAKAAGLRTHALVGLGAALFMVVSKYGFADVVGETGTNLDPSRIAAQIVSGIGFIGGGLIFVRRDAVRGLTTAASVWVTAAVGMAAGAGMWVIAAATTVGYGLVVYGLTAVSRRLPRSSTAPSAVDLVYVAGRGVLSRALETATGGDFAVDRVKVQPARGQWRGEDDVRHVRFEVAGTGALADLAVEIEGIDGVLEVRVQDANAVAE